MVTKNSLNKKNLMYLFVLFIIGIPLIIFLMNKGTSNIFLKYPLIKTMDSFNEVVLVSERYKGTTLIQTINNKHFSVMAYDWNIKPSMLHFFLESGDSLSRKAGSDTIYLYKKVNNSVLLFELHCLE